jgi:sphingomyelin phosphodiesterase acid-like 3
VYGDQVLTMGTSGVQQLVTIRRIDSCLRRLFVGALVLLAVSVAGAQPASKNSPGKLLIASDIHFNPMADPTLVADLVATDVAQWEGILRRSKLTAFSPYGQDSNWWLMRSAFDAMVRTEPHPALVMFTGDLLAHSFPKTYTGITHDNDPEHYRAFVLKTFDFIALEFRKRFPDAKVLLTPGNNDEECGDYSIAENGIFLSDTAERAGALAREGAQFTATWKALGSYSIEHPTLQGVRIVSLNTVFWSNKYRASSFPKGCATVSSNAASALLAWLESHLAGAEQAHEKVWLMFHIPPGVDGWASTHPSGSGVSGAPAKSCADSIVPMWVPEWTASFEKLLERYHNTVLVSFAGHTHVDSFMLAGDGESKQFVVIDPAVSPVYDQNPGFRIVNFRGDGTLADQTTYYLTNLTKAGGSTRGRWKKEYTFSRQWKVRQLDSASLTKIYNEITSGSNARDRWLKLYMVSSTAMPIPAADVKGLYCAISALDPKSYAVCACAVQNQP